MIAIKPKAYSYIRFSSPEQAKGDSYRRQHVAAVEYCEKHGLELAKSQEYTFFDKGLSAHHGQHLDDDGQLGRFFKFVESGAISRGSYLIVENLDRLSRERVDKALTSFLTLLRAGINVVTLSDGYVYKEGATAMELMMSIMHMGRAHSESDIKSQRLTAVWKRKKALARTDKKPLGRACPYWLELVDGKYRPISERVDTVRLIFDLAIMGHGQGVIPRLLNERGLPVFGSVSGVSPRNKSGAWGNSSVSKLLSNRALLGEYQPTHIVNRVRMNDGEPVAGFFPLVIPEDIFYRAQAVRAERTVHRTGNQSARFNVLQGIAKCSMCGDAMHLVNKGRPPKGATYIQCHSARKGVCDNGYVRVERAELILREVLAKVDSLSLVQANQNEIAKALDVVVGKLRTTSERYETTVALLNQSPSNALATMVARLEGEIAAFKAQQDVLRESMAVTRIESKEDFFERLDLVSFEGRHAANSLLKRLGVRLEVLTQDPKDQWYAVHIVGAGSFAIFHNHDTVTILAVESDSLDTLLKHGDIDVETHESLSAVGDMFKRTAGKLRDQIIAELGLKPKLKS